MNLSAKDNHGKAVDWWFMYKVAGNSKTKAGKKVPKLNGTEYVYFDSTDGSSAKLMRPDDFVNKNGALPNTLNQLYAQPGPSNEHRGWFFYNDEDPVTGKINGTLGHTKGVLAFDFSSNTALWLVQSTPNFPPQGKYDFPDSGMPNAQTLLCITLQNADTSRTLANQMFVGHQPNVYLSSAVPSDLVGKPNDPRVQLMEGKIVEGNSPYSGSIPFRSKGGVKFTSIAKNRFWGLDFYNDLVGPTLHDDLDVETWEHGTTPPSLDNDDIHTVVDMGGIDLNPLGYDITWPETDDHAKLAISARSESTHYICVGDINFTLSMRKRSGGTVAFKCEPLWRSISSILVDVTTHLKTGSKAAHAQLDRKNGKTTADPAVKITAAGIKSGSLPAQLATMPRKKPGRTAARKTAAKGTVAGKPAPAKTKAKKKTG
ncbi:MAG TPA: deoxyribonuclease II family protein [Rhizomicrobium sp.]